MQDDAAFLIGDAQRMQEDCDGLPAMHKYALTYAEVIVISV